MEKQFTKADLKDLMLVKTRDGAWNIYFASSHALFQISDTNGNVGSQLYLVSYNSDLTYYGPCMYDAVEVASTDDCSEVLKAIYSHKDICCIGGFCTLWERKEETEQEKKLKALITDLQQKLEEATKQLAEIEGQQ